MPPKPDKPCPFAGLVKEVGIKLSTSCEMFVLGGSGKGEGFLDNPPGLSNTNNAGRACG